MLANQLNTTNNTLPALIPAPPPGTYLYKYSGTYSTAYFDDFDLVWTPAAALTTTLNPGEGAFVKSPVATTLTFVGEVLQGSLSNSLPANALAMRSSMVPQAGKVTTDLSIPGEAGDYLYRYVNGNYQTSYFDDFDLIWTPTEPQVGVGEAFFYKKAASGTKTIWVRNFTVQ